MVGFWEGEELRTTDGSDGDSVGKIVGFLDGTEVEGNDGFVVGKAEGRHDGPLGSTDGTEEGATLGTPDGYSVRLMDGF